ncbi:MAG: MltA domain-containing protein [Burkholderiales bacterium]|nr:MltA domain-containing protein [Burkholderiales bacterium]
MVHQTKNTNTTSAHSASSTISHMMVLHREEKRQLGLKRSALWMPTMIVAWLAGCSSVPLESPAPITASRPGVSTQLPPGVPAPGTLMPQPDGRGDLLRPKSQWIPAQWSDLPGWDRDQLVDWWPAWLKSCSKPAPGWWGLCQRARQLGNQPDEIQLRQFVQSHFKPWRVLSYEGQSTGLLTGYFEPLLEGKRQPDARYRYPLYKAPADLGIRKPHYTRSELDNSVDGRASVAGRELVYLADPLDVLLIQVQGSGRVRLLDETGPNGQPKVIRLAFGGHNDQPYQSVARWLVDQGAITLEQASWQAIRNWASLNPDRVPEMLRVNPRVVYFKEEALSDPESGPNGAQGVPLTPRRSVAVDVDSVPLGTPMWLDSTQPQAWSTSPAPATPLQRLVMAQDKGGAINGAVRADFFWGWGDEALNQAGRTKQPLSVWVLWPSVP